MSNIYKSNNNVVYSCTYHVVWTTKYRSAVLVDEVLKTLSTALENECIRYNAEVIELEITPDHVHLLVEVDPQFGIHTLIKRIKGASSYQLRKQYSYLKSNSTLWTNSYFVSTVGGASLSVVKAYIQNQ